MASFGYYKHKEQHKLIKLLHNKKLTMLLVIFAAACVLVTFSNKGIIQRIKSENEKKTLTDRVHALELENQRLRCEEKNLTSDLSTIEHVAREKHGMVKPGEIVYRIREINK